MITIRGKNEAAIVARIEKELKGEDVDIFVTEDAEDGEELSLEEILARMSYNLNRSRIYIGRLVGNSQREYEEARELNTLMTPISLFFASLLEDAHANNKNPVSTQDKLKTNLERVKEISKNLQKEGKLPVKE